jgi:hypothetical protein
MNGTELISLILAFLSGSLVTLFVAESFRRRARPERFTEKIYDRKLEIYQQIAAAFHQLWFSGDIRPLHNAFGTSFILLPSGITEQLSVFLAHYESIPEQEKAAFSVRGVLILNEIRADLGMENIEEASAEVFFKNKNLLGGR